MTEPKTSRGRLCVYCGSSDQVSDIYKDAARGVGAFCAAQGMTLVYGGGHTGLMGITADAALAQGGEVIGVIPTFLHDKEVAHSGLTQLHVCETMHERQNKMAELADGFVLLPGGLGSLAEFFEIITWKQLHLHAKPVYVLNVEGYWDGLPQMIGSIRDHGFLRENPDSLYRVIGHIDEILLSGEI